MATIREIQILADEAGLFHAAAGEFSRIAEAAVADHGAFYVALSGGSTPAGLYGRLLSEEFRACVPWSKTFFFWSDERHVPPDHKDSNFSLANEHLLSKLDLTPEQVLRVHGEYEDAAKAAGDYDQLLRSFFRLTDSQLPRFDLILLGMGPEGHAASLFPGTKALGETDRLVVSNWVGKLYTDRITFTAQTINNAAAVLLMVNGDDKALALKGVLEGPHEPDQLPVQLVQPAHGRLIWLITESAGHALSEKLK